MPGALSSVRLSCTLLLLCESALWAAPGCNAQLSQNSGINTSDTWVTFDLTTQSQISSSTAPPAITQTHHLEIGYDSSGNIVVNLWPTGTTGLATDSGQVGVIRLSNGNVTVFDQSGTPIPYVLPASNVTAFNPLSLLGTNPGASILSQIVVPNISTQATRTSAIVSYSGSEAILTGSFTSGGSPGTAKWNYVQAGSQWVASQVSFSVSKPDFNATRTLYFSNVNWNDNSTNDTARATRGSTAVNPPPINSATPAALTASSSSNCVPYETSQGGTQNVVFQHGLFSNGCTWWRMEPWLNQYFRFGIELAPTLNNTDTLTNQGNALIADMNSAGGNGYILIGHSQGGLISRYATQQFQSLNANPPIVTGVVTLDTPHQGAPIAGVIQGAANNVLVPDLANIYGDVGCGSAYDNILCYLVALQYSGISQQLVNIGAITDLVPGSAFLTQPEQSSGKFPKGGDCRQYRPALDRS